MARYFYEQRRILPRDGSPFRRACLIVILLGVPLIGLPIKESVDSAGAVGPDSLTEEPAPSLFLGRVLVAIIDGTEVPFVAHRKGVSYIKRQEVEPFHATPGARITSRRQIKFSPDYAEIADLRVKPINVREMKLQESFTQNFGIAVQEQNRMDLLAGGTDPSLVGPSISTGSNSPLSGGSDEGLADRMMMDSADNLEYLREEAARIQEELSDVAGEFDTLRVSFILRSGMELKDAFIHIHLSCRLPGEPPGSEKPQGYFHSLGDVGAKEEFPVTFFLTGFPPGPVIEEIQYTLFSNETEIPTNLSENRFHVTLDEAFDFLYAEYVSGGGNKTLEPKCFQPLVGIETMPGLPREIWPEYQASLTVLGDGSVDDVHLSGNSCQDLSGLVKQLEELHFFPALENGIPVERRIDVPLAPLLGEP